MPNRLRNLSGGEVIKIFQTFDFKLIFGKGSHCKLARINNDGTRQVIVVPRHQSISKGTLKSIYNKALNYLSEEQLKPLFYFL